jgi:hypothetical protein
MPLSIGAAIGIGAFAAVWRFSADNGALGLLLAISGSGTAIAFFPYTSWMNSQIVSPRSATRLVRSLGVGLTGIGV